MPTILVTTGRTPFEVTILAAATTAGIALLAAGERPRSVAEAMPAAVQSIWEIALIVSGLVGLAGVYWPGPSVTGFGAELSAVVVLGTATAMYAIALFAISGLQALAAGAFIAAVSGASWWRAGQIWADLQRVLHANTGG